MKRDSAVSDAGAPSTRVPAAPPRNPLPPQFDGLAQLAAGICETPFASLVLPDCGESWHGLGSRTIPAGRDPFFDHVICAPEIFEVRDAARDPRFATTLVKGAPAVRGFAGCALRGNQGEVLGALAVYDDKVRRFSASQRAMLTLLARQCATQAALHARVAELEILATAGRSSPAAPTGAAQFTALLDSAPVAVYHVNTASDLTYVNSEYRRMFGLAPDQTPDDWVHGVHPEDRERVEAICVEFSRHQRAMTFEYRAVLGDAAARFYLEKVVPVRGLTGYVGTISDFTDLVDVRGELHKAETLFRNTIDQAPIGIVYADRTGKFLRFNDAFCALLGFTSAELSSSSMTELTHPGDAESAAVQIDRLWRGEVGFLDFEKRYIRKDRSSVWVRTTTALVRDGDRVECSVEYLRDITHRKDLAAQLTQQRTLLEAVISDLPVALLACDVEGKVTHYNRAAVELHCIQPNDSKQMADVFLMDGVTPVPEGDGPLARALRGEIISNLELTVIPHDSTPRTTLSSARRLVGPDGHVLGAVAVIQDTTERKHQDMELERVHKELLTASREAGMAEVATNVLHNVGNILNSVNISASLVAERVRLSKASGVSRLAGLLLEQGPNAGRFITEDERGKKIPEYLAALGEQLQTDQRSTLEELALLRDNLEHIKDTVTMQQSYAKLCGVTETAEVVDLVEDSLRLNAGAFARHGVTLKRDFGSTPKINVDKHKVLQILVNLVRNAKYACDDSGRVDKLITLRTERTAQGVRISVIDNGIGIPPENMGRLFRHGFTTRESGHGFGLHSGAIAAQELGGSLRAESEGTGRGASFILELPASPPQASRA